jgi:hypothetical protein
MNKLAKWIVAATMSGVCGSAVAQVTYNYQGNDFTIVAAPYTTADSVSGSFTVSTPLSANLTDATVIPTTWSLTDGVLALSNTTPNLNLFDLIISTNPLGQIDYWNFAASADGPANVSNGQIQTIYTSPADAFGEPAHGQDSGQPRFGTGSGFVLTPPPGGWTTPVPLPSTLTSAASGLALLFGLGVLRGRRPHRLTA